MPVDKKGNAYVVNYELHDIIIIPIQSSRFVVKEELCEEGKNNLAWKRSKLDVS